MTNVFFNFHVVNQTIALVCHFFSNICSLLLQHTYPLALNLHFLQNIINFSLILEFTFTVFIAVECQSPVARRGR